MAKKKLKNEYIADGAARKASFKERKRGVMKKVRELSTLCGIDACAIVYSNSLDPRPEIWPNSQGVQRVLEKFKAKPNWANCLNQEALIRGKINKVKDKLKKRIKENREKEMTNFMFGYIGGATETENDMKIEDLIGMKKVAEKNLKEIKWKMEELDRTQVYVPAPPNSEEMVINNGENNAKMVDQILEFDMENDINWKQWWNEIVDSQ